MAAVRTPHGGDTRSMPGCGKPVVHCSAYPAAVKGRITFPFMTGDQQQNSFATGNCTLERTIDGDPGAIQRVTMQVENPVRLDLSGTKPPIPAAIERR